MRCLPFLHGDSKEEDPVNKSASVRSLSTTSTERDVRSGSDFNSLNVSDMSAESIRRTQYPSFTDRPSNLRVFSFSELKNATRNFSRSLMVGEGGFGCVYRGVIKNSDEPTERTEIAVKQLNRKGLQASYFSSELYRLQAFNAHSNFLLLVLHILHYVFFPTFKRSENKPAFPSHQFYFLQKRNHYFIQETRTTIYSQAWHKKFLSSAPCLMNPF